MAATQTIIPLGLDAVHRIASSIQQRQAQFGEDFEMSVGVVLMNYGDHLVHVRCIAGEWEGTKGDLTTRNGVPLCPNGHPLIETTRAPRLALVESAEGH